MILKISMIMFLTKIIPDYLPITNCILIVFSIFFFIFIGELFCRYFLGLGTPPLLISHPRIEYIYKPNQDLYRFGNHFSTNQYGMRSEPFTNKKNNNELRIMVFGDSVVNGSSLIDQSELATTILKNKFTKTIDRNVVVGNISAGSWGPGNWLAYAQEYGFFDADIIILIVSSHDYIDNPTFEPLNKNTHPTEKPILALIEYIERYVPRYFSQKFGKASLTNTTDQFSTLETSQFILKEAEKGLNDLRAFLKLAKDHSKTVMVFQHYEKKEIKTGHTLPGNKLIKEVCNQLQIIPISLEPYFSRSIEEGVNPYIDNIHPNSSGQQLIAEAILAKINLKDDILLDHSIKKPLDEVF